MVTRTLVSYLSAIIACMSVAALPARADTVAELDSLSLATASLSSGLGLAHSQIGRDDLLGALATLERMLINHPDTQQALLLHASLLCRLDDRSGSTIEFDNLRRRGIPDAVWNKATAPCNTNGNTSRTRAPGHD